ncbi:putative methanogenesis marker protein 1 [Legionella massiliensis]|uniref:Putative methanogenesis marker protein 1 n=2 Tax=Legionella massiliensis TaxID=1034943 RepID=A0A078KXC8_9GAMM|nr:putative methanogenesis marker protein 1 [Legionella massiliensis]CEE13374.1 YcaO-like family protein [Legionella massiliensis]
MFDLGGTYRAVSPKETLDKIEPLLWDKFGISRVANITGLDVLNIPTYIAIRPGSKILSTSQGKGISHELAKISAIMESIESWHAERLSSPKLVGSYRVLKPSYNLVELEQLINGHFHLTADALYNLELSWVGGIELNSGREVYFPSSLIDLDSLILSSKRLGCFPGTSNGLASGNTYQEAVCHGLYEVIERHSWALAETAKAAYVDPSSIKAAHLLELFNIMQAHEIKFKICDLTSANGVPAYSATLFDLKGTRNLDFFSGAGAHLSSVVALSRAITEAVQSRLTMISGSRDDIYPANYKFKRKFYRNGFPKIEKLEPSYPFIETEIPANFEACIKDLLKRLKNQGFEQVIVYNHTRPELAIPVVHVIIPGMHFDWFKHKTQAYVPEYFC